ncbi:kinesin-like protein KIF19 [Eurytemora carolleeae]|uniref:kinesin-like protein KIF19 n=1 Tax=Eurytemora carolleeae TaxID=1294199 RepID=UPI000C764442|nr:kinesin-like protein KIF19 [Eurytemora carolleeae]|eukprot:XP_023326016.1 kinesin-like protein KIF19 [Eurytemora affinis]
MSYLEIYNENIRDLLDPASGFLELREDSKGKNIQVTGLSEITTSSPDEVMRMLTKGNRERTQEPTAANKTSSRSHALLMVNYKQTSKSKTSHSVKNGRLYMIDLAGSERASNTQNKGIRLKEGAHINRSLLALGNCINALAENKTKYVNYRDSKLTRLLKDALSGNCHTVMIAHISPADRHFDESRNTLVYADRAKNISNKVRRNVLDVSYHVSQYQNIISELKGEIGRLKEKISNEPTNHGATATKQQIAELKELRDALVANFREQMSLRHRLMEIDNHILSLSMEFEKQNIIVTEWETEKVKSRSERISEKKRKKKSKKDTPKIYLEPDTDESEADRQDSEDVESGFEDNEPTQEGEEEEEGEEGRKEEEGEEEENKEDEDEEEKEKDGDRDEDEGKKTPIHLIFLLCVPIFVTVLGFNCCFSKEKEEKAMKVIYNNSDSENDDCNGEVDDDVDNDDDADAELPSRISTTEEKEILSLLCKVHELEIDKVEMKSEGLMKEHEVRRRDLLILKYDKQRSLCDEIIQRQQKLIEAMDSSKLNKSMGAQAPMPSILLYSRCQGPYASYTILFLVPRLLYLLYFCILGALAPMPPILLYSKGRQVER